MIIFVLVFIFSDGVWYVWPQGKIQGVEWDIFHIKHSLRKDSFKDRFGTIFSGKLLWPAISVSGRGHIPNLTWLMTLAWKGGVRPGFNIKYNMRTLFVEQKKFCGVSVHTWPATFQASKYWSVTVNWLTVCWVRGHKAIRPAGKILYLLEYTPGRTLQTNDNARCAGPVTSGDDIRSAECIFWIIQNLYYIWTIC